MSWIFEAGYRAGREHDWQSIVCVLALLVLAGMVVLVVQRGGRDR